MMFIKQVTEQLSIMSETEKEEWILTQARLVKKIEEKDFLMSLSGEKKITYMPSQKEIDEFCEKVEGGEIYLEYETHYYEFDDGRYVDDWKVWHNDPFEAMIFLDRTFQGCHDLMILNEYKSVSDILDRITRLEFQVVEAEDSEDFCDDSPFTVVDADKEGMLSVNIKEVGTDWLISIVRMKDKWESQELAKRLVRIFTLPICRKINPNILIEEKIPEDLFSHMLHILNEEILNEEIMFRKMFSEIRYSHEKYMFEKKLKRKQEIALNIQLKCIEVKKRQKVSGLEPSWKQIKELLEQLKYERYIDDQWEIEEVWKICGILIKEDKLEKEDWKLRKNILSDIIKHHYYNSYGCYDPILELSEKLCTNSEEFLAYAKILEDSGYYEEKAAYLYQQYGRDEKYVSYLETHLKKSSETYVALIEYYKEHNNFDQARQVAEQGLEKCKDDLTDIFIYLLLDAKRREDKDRFKKFYSSAKRRRGADIVRIDAILKRENLEEIK